MEIVELNYTSGHILIIIMKKNVSDINPAQRNFINSIINNETFFSDFLEVSLHPVDEHNLRMLLTLSNAPEGAIYLLNNFETGEHPLVYGHDIYGAENMLSDNHAQLNLGKLYYKKRQTDKAHGAYGQFRVFDEINGRLNPLGVKRCLKNQLREQVKERIILEYFYGYCNVAHLAYSMNSHKNNNQLRHEKRIYLSMPYYEGYQTLDDLYLLHSEEIYKKGIYCYYRSLIKLYEFGLFQEDPNFKNFMVKSDISGNVISGFLIDFAAVYLVDESKTFEDYYIDSFPEGMVVSRQIENLFNPIVVDMIGPGLIVHFKEKTHCCCTIS